MNPSPTAHPFILLLAKTASILFLSELAIMYTLPVLGELNPWLEALLDAVMATLLAGTLTYYLVLSPLYRTADEEEPSQNKSFNDLSLFIAKFGVVVFTVESGIMLLLPMLELHELDLGRFLDAILLSLFTSPVLLYWAMGHTPLGDHSPKIPFLGRLQNVHALFLLLFLPSIISLVLLTMALIHSEEKTQRALLRSEEQQRMETLRREMLRDIRMVSQDLLILSRQVELMEMLEGEEEAIKLIHRDYLNFLLIKNAYHRLRLLDQDGLEILGVENTAHGPALIPAERLENKRERPYFKATITMTPGEIYISPMDLRMDGPQIRQPLLPLIRFATPLFDEDGKRHGIMVLDLLAERFLTRMDSSHGASHSSLMLLNEQGYWLHGREAAELWGFQFTDRREQTFTQRYPGVWPLVRDQIQGQTDTPHGLFTFREVYPSPSWLRRGLPNQFREKYPTKEYKSFVMDDDATEEAMTTPRSPNAPVWKLVSFISSDMETHQFKDLRNRMILLFFVLSTLLALGLWNLAKALARRNRAEAELQIYSSKLERHSNELEQMVQERTKQLVHAERLVTLGTFSAGMAHEINNPNAFISGNVQFLRKFWELAMPILLRHANEDPSGRIKMFADEIGSTLDGIVDGSQRISKIVDSLKTYSKGGMETDKVDCRLTDPILDAQNLLRHKFKKSTTTLKINVPAEILLYCDRQQICQVFVNLFNNAMEALEDAGIEQGEISVRAQEIDQRAWVWVKDNGPGIPEQAAGKIFDPFYTTKGKTKGTGLGLSIVHGIIQDHKGQITVYSPPEGTTEFLIILPTNSLHKSQRIQLGGRGGRERAGMPR